MKQNEIRELTDQELTQQLADSQKALLNFKIQSKNGTLEDTSRVKATRRDIARLLTEARQRELKEAVQ